ncbi:DUF1858 domain-containing protein [bacterium]|nr:DUF1858 domain-containing protein [bacterium]
MSTGTGITKEMAVRDVLRAFPRTRAVFDRYGMHGCGGAEGPPEPVAFFAQMHGLDVNAFLAELEGAVDRPIREVDPCPCGLGGGEIQTSSPLAGEAGWGVSPRTAALLSAPKSGSTGGKCTHGEAGKSLARIFIRTSLLVFLCYGALTGIAAFLSLTTPWAALPAVIEWPALAQSHAHAQVFGFVVMFILGISYHVMPRFMGVPLRNISAAWASYGLLLGGVILRSLYQPFAQNSAAAETAFLGSMLEVGAVVAFLTVVRSTLREHKRILPDGRSGQPFVHIQYLMAGGAWLLAAACLGAVGAGVMLVRGVNVQPSALNSAWINLSIIGFAGMFIFGVGQRTMPHFLALDDLNPKAGRAGLIALTAGLTLQMISLASPYYIGLVAVSALLELTGFTLFLIAVPLLGRLPVHRPAAPPFFASFVRVGFVFGWLGTAGYAAASVAAAFGVDVPRMVTDAYRHAWTIGWITMLIVGVGYRLIPIFFGRAISMPRAVPVIFALISGGVAIRIAADILSIAFPGAYPWVNLSGALILPAMILFAVEIWRLTSSEEPISLQPATPALTLDANVAAVLEAYPELLPVFVHHGFGALQNPVARKTVARFVTIGQAAKKHGLDPEFFLAELIARAPIV